MASIKLNPIAKGLSGTIGNLVIKQYKGKTVVASKASSSRKLSPLQKESRQKFKLAASKAKALLRNADKKAYYLHKAEKNNQPNAYTAALQDVLRNQVPDEKTITETNLRNAKAAARAITAKGKKVVQIEVLTSEGVLIESTRVTAKDSNSFRFKLKKARAQSKPLIVNVTMFDKE